MNKEDINYLVFWKTIKVKGSRGTICIFDPRENSAKFFRIHSHKRFRIKSILRIGLYNYNQRRLCFCFSSTVPVGFFNNEVWEFYNNTKWMRISLDDQVL